jgi:hypothetical protein
VVVDDSDDDNRLGIARAKNKCLEQLDDCEHIFLFDDDCYPIKKGWHEIYIEASKYSGYQFFAHTRDTRHEKFAGGYFDIILKKEVKTYQAEGFEDLCYDQRAALEIIRKHGLRYDHPVVEVGSAKIKVHHNSMGVMLYISKKCLETVGGFNTEYQIYGGEHGGYSYRARNLKMTAHPTADVDGADEHFCVLDVDDPKHTTSLGKSEVNVYGKKNEPIFEKEKFSTQKMPYKNGMEAKPIVYKQSINFLK